MIEKIEPPDGDGNFVVRKFILHNKIIEKIETPEGDGNKIKCTTDCAFCIIEKIETPEGDGNWEAISKYIIIIH